MNAKGSWLEVSGVGVQKTQLQRNLNSFMNGTVLFVGIGYCYVILHYLYTLTILVKHRFSK